MPTVLEKTKKNTEEVLIITPIEEVTQEVTIPEMKKSLFLKEEIEKKESTETVSFPKEKTLWDVAEELAKKPLIRVFDEDLVYGSNMMTKLLQEETL